MEPVETVADILVEVALNIGLCCLYLCEKPFL